MNDQPVKPINKRRIAHIRDESNGGFASSPFNFGSLPLEIQEIILMKAAVEVRLSSETFGVVYETLALVCKLWLKLINAAKFYERVKRKTLLRDPMCRYLANVQEIVVLGLEDRFIECLVTLGDKLYTTEYSGYHDYTSVIFVYDLDDSAVRHEEREKRKITFSNRRPLFVNELQNVVGFLISYPHTNTLYVIEESNTDTTEVFQINAEDGKVLRRWDVDIPYYDISSIALHSYGANLLITGDSNVCIHNTSTGERVKTKNLLDEDVPGNKCFVAATLLDEKSLESLVTFVSGDQVDDDIASDDHQHRLQYGPSGFTLSDYRTGRRRVLRVNETTSKKIDAFDMWYDNARGLVFCHTVPSGMIALRLTY